MEETIRVSEASAILVIDDDHGQLRTLSDILKSESLAPICCQSGHEALHACTAHDAPVAILDLRLPDIDGLQLLAQLLQKSPDLKVIVHTGYASLESAMGAINCGAFAYVQKLSNIEELLSQVHRAFHLHWAKYSERLEREVEKRTQALVNANDALRKSENRFRGLLEGSIQGVLVHRHFRPLYVNPAFAAMLGYDAPADLYALDSTFPLFAPHEHERMRQHHQARLQQRPEAPTRYEIEAVRQDGAPRWLSCICQRIMWEGEAAVQSTYVDISACKQAKAERERLEAQLRRSQNMEAIGVLAGGIAHEFNNLLGGIIGFADLIRFDAQPGGDIDEHAQQILQAGRRAKELVQQILTFSRRSQPEARQAVSLMRVVNDGLRLIRASLPSTIAIHSYFTQAPTTVWANANQLHQILLNLCANAGHAMRGRGGRLDIQVDTCALSHPGPSSHLPVASGPYALLRVSDTGCGMSQEVVERVFEPFFTTKEVGEGVGLGLSVVYSIVESYGGTITVESQMGIGTTIVIYLPADGQAESSSGTAQRQLPHGQGRILVVDDEATLVRFAQQILERLGYKVAATTSSAEALERFRLDPQGFDAVLTDQTMPQMTGEELARAIRDLHATIPIILCSGYSQGLTVHKLQDLRIDAFCIKPLEAHELANTLHQLLSQRRH